MCLLSKYVLQSLAHLLIVLTLPCRAVFNFFLIVFFFFFETVSLCRPENLDHPASAS
jgi:hypothetical protein